MHIQDPISEQVLTDEKRLLKLLNNTEISIAVSSKSKQTLHFFFQMLCFQYTSMIEFLVYFVNECVYGYYRRMCVG